MKQVEYWRWRYRDRKTGQIVRTMFQMTAAEARRYPGAEPIDGTMLLREVEDDFRDTLPAVREPLRQAYGVEKVADGRVQGALHD